MSYAAALNTVYLPMGSSSTDLYSAERTALDHKYGASVLAVDATTGQEKWVYQTVHSDLWYFDLPMQPSFIDFTKADGSTVRCHSRVRPTQSTRTASSRWPAFPARRRPSAPSRPLT